MMLNRFIPFLILFASLTGCTSGYQTEDLFGTWQVTAFDSNLSGKAKQFVQDSRDKVVGLIYVIQEDGTAMTGKSGYRLRAGKWMYNEEKNLLSFPGEGQLRLAEQYKVRSMNESTLKLSFRVPDMGELFLVLKRQKDYEIDVATELDVEEETLDTAP